MKRNTETIAQIGVVQGTSRIWIAKKVNFLQLAPGVKFLFLFIMFLIFLVLLIFFAEDGGNSDRYEQKAGRGRNGPHGSQRGRGHVRVDRVASGGGAYKGKQPPDR